MTDEWDIRTLMNILDSFYTPAILDPNYKLSPSSVYYSPPADSLSSYLHHATYDIDMLLTGQRYMVYLKSLPINDDPEVFGLHSNANITFLQMETNNLFQTLLSLQPRASGGKASGRSRDAVIEDTALNILKRIPEFIHYEV